MSALEQVTIGKKVSGRTAWLRPDAAASYLRMVADGCPSAITDAGRTHAEQRAIFLDRYTTHYAASSRRDRRRYEGRTYWRKPHVASAATPGTSKHETGRALDLPGEARTWARSRGAAYGWIKDRVAGEPWHLEYDPEQDTHKDRDTGLDTQEDPDMHIIRRGSGTDPKRRYALVSGSRALEISRATYVRYRKAGHAAVQLAGAEYDSIIKGWK